MNDENLQPQEQEDPTAGWQQCGAVSADALWEARAQMHWALQVPAAIGKQLVEKQPDDSHTSFGWLEERRAFATEWSSGEPYVSAALQVGTLNILLDHDNGNEVFELNGKTLADGFDWLRGRITELGGSLPGDLSGFDDMPAHAVHAGGAAFSADSAALAEWVRYFENADRMLHKIGMAFDFARPVRIWPHHFDVATLILFSEDADPATAKCIGMGFTPGDETWYREPYWYCTPYGADIDTSNLPELRGGEWRTTGDRPSAILRHAAITAGGSAAEQADAVQNWAESAIVACKALLGLADVGRRM